MSLVYALTDVKAGILQVTEHKLCWCQGTGTHTCQTGVLVSPVKQVVSSLLRIPWIMIRDI